MPPSCLAPPLPPACTPCLRERAGRVCWWGCSPCAARLQMAWALMAAAEQSMPQFTARMQTTSSYLSRCRAQVPASAPLAELLRRCC